MTVKACILGVAAAICLAVDPSAAVSAERVFLVGDSTVASYPETRKPLAGWGQMLPLHFDSQVTVVNRGIGGMSSKTYIDSGTWKKLLQETTKGDYIFIQLGHNDQYASMPDKFTHPDTTYQEYLKRYVDEARAAGCIPVLVTPVARATGLKADGTYTESHALRLPAGSKLPAANLTYPEAVREVAKTTQTPLIDLHARSKESIVALGFEKASELYLCCAPGVYAAYPDGKQDREHLSEKGARQFAGFVAEGIVALKLPLARHVKGVSGPATKGDAGARLPVRRAGQ